ncbi:WD40-repeat-containing domain protein, partial [Thamnocephalis sphaerospora]
FHLAVGTFMEGAGNKLQVVSLGASGEDDHEQLELTVTAEAEVLYPCTKVMTQPEYGDSCLLATTSDMLRIWEHKQGPEGGLQLRAELCSAKSDMMAPLTSFDWSDAKPSLLVTCSVDTTCTVWDVVTKQAKTQLIAHDREVFDVSFVAGSQDIFASVGADGSVRMFDLRSLEHSSIIYESPGSDHRAPAPLLRLACNRKSTHYLATFHMDAQTIQVLDARMPGTPFAELQAHTGPVNSIAWSPESESNLISCGDDGQILLWDIKDSAGSMQPGISSSGNSTVSVKGAHTVAAEANVATWSRTLPSWIGVTSGQTLYALRI